MPERLPSGDGEVLSSQPPVFMQPETKDDVDDEGQKLTNEDFRKLLMLPRSHLASGTAAVHDAHLDREEHDDDDDDAATRRKKKKSYYAKLKRDEEERQKELQAKYRDRARERRDVQTRDEPDMLSTTADYRAVAPDAKSIENYAERRRQVIQESKYLGGDMEHTHLVKGLDFALLDKVRAEIVSKEREEEDEEMENALTQNKGEEEDPEEKIQFKAKIGRNIYRAVFKMRPAQHNELFLPKRMAYAVDLEDAYGDFDIPNTIIRSKADCPSFETTTTLSTNDIVINKLTQILSYLRQGKRDQKKLRKKDKGRLKEDRNREKEGADRDENIFGDVGDYVHSVRKGSNDAKDRDRGTATEGAGPERREYSDQLVGIDHRQEGGRWDKRGGADHSTHSSNRQSYFEKPQEEEEQRQEVQSSKELVRSINNKFKGYVELEEEKKRLSMIVEEDRMKKLKAKTEIDSYAECYPGMMESADAIDDSDDDADYTKMDQGNKKGPVGRWDFDTQEEYSAYMSSREALPKAAFQYGVKMSDGRKTRRAGPKDEKNKLDRELQQINRIMDKRKLPVTVAPSKRRKR